MASSKEVVKISDITKFGDSLARSIRGNLRAVTKKLGGSGMVKLGKGESRSGKVSISIIIGEGKKDPGNITKPIIGMIRAIESGARPHPISASNKPYLKFFWKKANKTFRGLSVNHPGMVGFSPIEKSINSTKAKATEELKQAIKMNVKDILNMTIREINAK